MFFNYNDDYEFSGFVAVKANSNSIEVSQDVYDKILNTYVSLYINGEKLKEAAVELITMENYADYIIEKEIDIPAPKEIPSTIDKMIMNQVGDIQINAMKQNALNNNIKSELYVQKTSDKTLMGQLAQSQIRVMQLSSQAESAQKQSKILTQQLAQVQIESMNAQVKAENTNKLLIGQVADLSMQIMELKKGGK